MDNVPYGLIQYALSWFSVRGLVELMSGYIVLHIAFLVFLALTKHAFKLSFRASNAVARYIARLIVVSIAKGGLKCIRAIEARQKAREVNPEIKRLRRDWKREFKGKISWVEFQRMNEQFKKDREDHARWERQEEQRRRDNEEQRRQEEVNPYTSALSVFGLVEPFSQNDLKARYIKLIAGVHPDRVGFASNFIAAQVNNAKDTIMKARRWA